VRQQPQKVLERIPGWQGANVERLAGGLMNVSYLVRKKDSAAVLKIDSPETRAPRSDRATEAQLQTIAFEAGLAGAVIYQDERCYLSEYLEGETWTDQELRLTYKLTELAVALRRLHALPPGHETFDPVSAAQRYARRLPGDSAEAERHMATVSETGRPERLAFCHNDLVAENIMSAPDIRFIDWEYACGNDPMFDLATLVAHHNLGRNETDTLMRVYCGGNWEEFREPLETQMHLYESLLWLWQAARDE
jgi:thiamine kinase-like enzyme